MSPFHEQFRSIEYYWNSDAWLHQRMLFVSGPRQVGKTTLVQSKLCTRPESYFNWDNRSIRNAYQKNPDFFATADSGWICFDEIHKRPKWKDILKGIYDTHKNRYRFVVIGSARLDTFKKAGDSLVGRYFHTHLFPLNLPDFSNRDFTEPNNPTPLILEAAELPDAKETETLLNLGGFPEPYFSGSEGFTKRWLKEHQDLILTEDLRDLSRIIEIDKISALLPMLQAAVGNLVHLRKLGQDLETSHSNIKRWLTMLNTVQLIFPVTPYSKKIRRAYSLDKKWYFMDWRAATTNRFENYIAASLFRAVTLYTDRFGDRMTLHFVRTHDGTEVDFLICKEGKPWLLVEAKEGKPDLSAGVYRFSKELNVPCVVVTALPHLFKKIRGPEGQTIYCISWGKLGQVLP